VKEIRFSDHAFSKLDILASRNIIISREFVVEAICNPDKTESGSGDKIIAQKRLNEQLVVRVVYREFDAFILTITVYPGRRKRYEKN